METLISFLNSVIEFFDSLSTLEWVMYSVITVIIVYMVIYFTEIQEVKDWWGEVKASPITKRFSQLLKKLIGIISWIAIGVWIVIKLKHYYQLYPSETIICCLLIAFFFAVLPALFYYIFGIFTTVETGTMKFVIQGGEYIRTILANARRFFIWKFLGIHFVGFDFQGYNLHRWLINTDKENPNPSKKEISSWVLTDERLPDGKREVDNLWEMIPRMLIITDVELGGPDPMQVSVGIPLIFKVIDGHKFVFTYKADFTTPMSLIASLVSNNYISKLLSYPSLISKDDDYLDEIVDNYPLKCILEEFGLELFKIKMPLRSTDKSIEESARKKAIAEMNRDATLIDADAKARAITLVENAKLEAVINGLKKAFPKADENELLRHSTDLLGKKAFTEMPNLSTLITDLLRK